MVIHIEDFVDKKNNLTKALGGRSWDYNKLLALPDDEFAGFYLKIMEEYRNKDGWWGKKGAPSCSECHKEISEPKELRRYYGSSLHQECFNHVYRQYFLPSLKENNLKPQSPIAKYWERVSKLKF
jgi:hypothetical protein